MLSVMLMILGMIGMIVLLVCWLITIFVPGKSADLNSGALCMVGFPVACFLGSMAAHFVGW